MKFYQDHIILKTIIIREDENDIVKNMIINAFKNTEIKIIFKNNSDYMKNAKTWAYGQ